MMKDPNYWKNYLPDEIKEKAIALFDKGKQKTTFKSRGLDLTLYYFIVDKKATNIVGVNGTGNYAMIAAGVGYYLVEKGFNVFMFDFQGHGDSEGQRGDFTIPLLVENCKDVVSFISKNYNKRIGVIGGSLGGFVTFYLGLSNGVKSIVCQNPGILSEKRFCNEVIKNRKRTIKILIPFIKRFSKIFPKFKINIDTYINPKGFLEREEDLKIYMNDPDIVKEFTLRSIISQISTPPPKPLEKLKIPTMFLVPTKDRLMSVSYVKDLYNNLPNIKKRFVKINGYHDYLIFHPKEAAKVICDWFDETL